MITADINGGAEYTSIQAAVDAAHENEKISIRNGVYHERVEIRSPGIELIGEDAEKTVIEYGLYAYMKADDAEKLGTFRSYTMLINADNVTCRNITVRNSAGFGKDIGQAVAVYAEGDMIRFENCRMLGRQDTLFTGPLPLKEKEKGGFRGPTEFAERRPVRQFYNDCYIEGDVDFIFGSAAAYFENCEIKSLSRNEEINGYVTASSAYKDMRFGYIFDRCRFTSDCPPETVYLGRPWRNYAKTVLINCDIGEHIRRDAFHDWNKADAHKTVFFGMYGCTGKEFHDLPDFVKILTEDEAEQFSKEYFIGNFLKI